MHRYTIHLLAGNDVKKAITIDITESNVAIPEIDSSEGIAAVPFERPRLTIAAAI
jgi:hypothetical protein